MRDTSLIINIVVRLVLIMHDARASYFYSLCSNITVYHVTCLVLAKNRQQFCMRTHLGLASGPVALLTHKMDVFSLIYCFWRKL